VHTHAHTRTHRFTVGHETHTQQLSSLLALCQPACQHTNTHSLPSGLQHTPPLTAHLDLCVCVCMCVCVYTVPFTPALHLNMGLFSEHHSRMIALQKSL